MRICDIGYNALGAEPTREGIGVLGLANLDALGVAERLRGLAAKLQTVATNLIHLAGNADLNSLAERLKILTAPVTPGASPGLVSQEVDRLLAELEEPVPAG